MSRVDEAHSSIDPVRHPLADLAGSSNHGAVPMARDLTQIRPPVEAVNMCRTGELRPPLPSEAEPSSSTVSMR